MLTLLLRAGDALAGIALGIAVALALVFIVICLAEDRA